MSAHNKITHRAGAHRANDFFVHDEIQKHGTQFVFFHTEFFMDTTQWISTGFHISIGGNVSILLPMNNILEQNNILPVGLEPTTYGS